MKQKIIFYFLAIILLAGCNSSKDLTVNEKNISQQDLKKEQSQTINNSQNSNNKEDVKSESSQNDMKQQVNSDEQKENLTAEYSQAVIKTNKGDIVVKFYGEDSPLTVNNFLSLAKDGFYNGTKFHRVINEFMIQGGDPLSKDDNMKARWGTGGPGYKFNDEFNNHKLVRGSLAMANSGPNTNGSQFFIVTTEATPWLDGRHTNFGEVVDGMDVVMAIEGVETDGSDKPISDVVINEIELKK